MNEGSGVVEYLDDVVRWLNPKGFSTDEGRSPEEVKEAYPFLRGIDFIDMSEL